ncbi:MAG: glucose 1-dehydrogenase [Rhodospirillales bacterium]|jgi:2-hydroxycyclohexanecarboxyl-CoA dehydrogenase|nr:glucose 1-dehydrogenase [Rhodospirillales bacterium]MDP7241761.1 glucose 1-dehydrogenase [Rhodospirillales bacterium]HJO96472.1 glucose 1-dehydrogenase [Rhodospirillales bacterium]
MRGLEGKNIIVTGGGSGIGRAICHRLAEAGVKVGVFDLNRDGADQTVEEIATNAAAFTADIGDYDACRRAVGEFESSIGAIDALVNNAGWDLAMPFLQSDAELWQKLVAINFYGPINMCHVVLPGMVERGGGRIVNLSSDAGRVGSSGESVYAGCKGGVIAFSKTLAREHARHKINVNVLCPGPTDTPLFQHAMEGNPKLGDALIRAIPMRRLAAPEDHAGMVAFLCSDEASFITGQVVSVSGGLTMHG